MPGQILRAALLAVTLAGAPAAYADEPQSARFTQPVSDPFAPPLTDQGRPAPESPGEKLGDIVMTAGVTLAVQIAACVGLGFCIFSGF
jgi:hypothetical protein